MNKGIVSDISCDVCRDLIPLVADGVASEDSEALVHAHVTHCPACQAYLDSGGIQLPAPEPDAARVLGRIQRKLLAQSALTVDSGLNTSNRLRNELADQLDTNRLCRDLKGRSPYETTLTFYPEDNDRVFDSQNPLFRVGMEFSADSLPLPTVLYTGFHSADREPPEVTLEKAASYLVALKQAAANQGLAFDYYSATVYGRNITWLLLDVPTEAIPDQLPDETAAGEPQPAAEESASEAPAEGSFDALVALLQDRITQNGQTSPTVADASPANSARSLSDQRFALLYSEDSCFQPL